jgi:hypothetical protein
MKKRPNPYASQKFCKNNASFKFTIENNSIISLYMLYKVFYKLVNKLKMRLEA